MLDHKTYMQNYYQTHKERIKAQTKKYRLDHPEQTKINWMKHKAELFELIGDRCVICGSTERLYFHEIHGLTHSLTPKYYREHSQDFITVCYHHHITIHEFSKYPQIANYKIV